MFENVDNDDFSSFHHNFFHYDFYCNFQHDDDVFVSFYNDSFENSLEKSFKEYKFERQFN